MYSINVWIWEAWTAHLILISEFHHTFLSRKVWAFCQKNCVHSYLPKHCWYLQPFPTFLTNLIRLPSFNNSANGQQTWFARHLSTMVRMVNKPGSLAIFQQWREWSTTWFARHFLTMTRMVNKPGLLAIFQQWREWSTNLVRSPSFNNGANGQQTWFARHLSTMARMVNKWFVVWYYSCVYFKNVNRSFYVDNFWF